MLSAIPGLAVPGLAIPGDVLYPPSVPIIQGIAAGSLYASRASVTGSPSQASVSVQASSAEISLT